MTDKPIQLFLLLDGRQIAPSDVLDIVSYIIVGTGKEPSRFGCRLTLRSNLEGCWISLNSLAEADHCRDGLFAMVNKSRNANSEGVIYDD